MKAWVYDRFGGLDELHLRDLPMPASKAGEVVVRVRTVSANVIDNRARSGMMGPLVPSRFPRIPGADLAGVVSAVGPKSSRFKVGDEVFGALDPMKGGACAEYASIPEDQLASKPRELDFDQAASLPIAGLAALYAMRELGRVSRGDEVLIHGATGGVGLFAVQIARMLGAKVTAVGGGGGLERAKELGADVLIDHRQNQAPLGPYDVIFNGSGRMPYSMGRDHLKTEGRLIEPSPTIPVFIGSRFANLFRSKKHLMLMTTPRAEDLEYLGGLAANGSLQATIAGRFAFADAVAAFAKLEKGGAVGKIVVRVS